ncbi:rhodanese domain protein, partial [mine drainage metagenome]
ILSSDELILDNFRDKLKNWRNDIEIITYSSIINSGKVTVSSLIEITVQELQENKDSWKIIDVREPYEWTTGVIPEADMISMNDIASRINTLDKNNQYAIICEHGNRSLYAAIYLSDRGFKVPQLVVVWMNTDI